MKRTTSLDERIQTLLAEGKVPGCSIATIDRDGMKWSHAFGLADIETERPATPSTVYHLFSCTKIFTAVAVMQLVEEGILDVNAEVSTYLPELPQLEGIQLVHLLSHSAGLKETLRGLLAVYFPGEGAPSTAEALAEFGLKRATPPGSKVAYRNVNYALLGELISRVSGVPYRDYVRKHILDPVGSDADFEVSDARRPQMATGYVSRWDPTRLLLRVLTPAVVPRLERGRVGRFVALSDYNLSTSAIGGLVGSVESFAPFLRSQLNDGVPLLTADSTRRMQTVVANGQAGIESKIGVGLGWKFGQVDGRPFLNHEGGGAGYSSEMRLYPESGIGIVLSMNLSSITTTHRLAHRICESIHEHHSSSE